MLFFNGDRSPSESLGYRDFGGLIAYSIWPNSRIRPSLKKRIEIIMLTWALIIVGLISAIALNIEGAKTVSGSEIHSETEKLKYLTMIWALPFIGTILAMWLINKDIRKKQHQMEDEIAPAIKELGDRLKKLESGIQQKQNRHKLH